MPPPRATACKLCGAEFLIGARYCHVCGSERDAAARPQGLRSWTWLQDRLGLSSFSLAAGCIGALCLLVGLVVGFVSRSATLLDWQAIQLWRIEWILAAIAFFALGILLKKSH
jgi:hypothetical protein